MAWIGAELTDHLVARLGRLAAELQEVALQVQRTRGGNAVGAEIQHPHVAVHESFGDELRAFIAKPEMDCHGDLRRRKLF